MMPLGFAALHRKELRRRRLLEKGGTAMLITSGRVPGLSDEDHGVGSSDLFSN